MTGHRGTPTRTKARKRALDILFEGELRGVDPRTTLADRIGLAEPPVRPFTIELVNGFLDHAGEVDDLIASCLSPGWSLLRMPRVDRNLARVAVFELVYTDTPAEVVVNEAVDLAAELSTDESPGFLNGVLGRVADRLAASGRPVPATQASASAADTGPASVMDAAGPAPHTEPPAE